MRAWRSGECAWRSRPRARKRSCGPVMPRWTIHCAGVSEAGRDLVCRDLTRAEFTGFFGRAALASTLSRSNTMCLPARCTRAIRLPSSVEAIMPAGDFSGCFREPIQTDSMVSPVTRLSRPRAMVSTSGSSGTQSGYKIVVVDGASSGLRRRATSDDPRSPLSTRFHGLLLHSPIRYARAYTPSTADLPSFPVYSAAAQPVCATLGRPDRPRNIPSGVLH